MSHGFNSHTEISRAWQAARDQVAAAGIDMRRAPLFLTLGQPAGGIEEFFAASHVESALPSFPASDDAPLQIYGNQEGLFVCCKQTSVLGDFVQRWRASEAAEEFGGKPSSTAPLSATTNRSTAPAAATTYGTTGGGSAPDSWGTNSGEEPLFSPAGGAASGRTATLARPRIAEPHVTGAPGTSPSASETVRSIEHQLNELERQLALADEVLQPEPSVAASSLSAADIASKKFAVLCRLISEEREPYCPLNGVVVLVPIEVTDCGELAEQGGSCIQRDLQTVMRTMETEVSVQVVVCGLAACAGGDELLDRLSQEKLHGTFGLTLPTTPGGNLEASQRLIERASEWLCDGLFPALVCRVLRRDTDDELSDLAEQEANRRLHALVRSLRGRRQNLSRLLGGSLSATPGHWRLRGCFFAPTASQTPHHPVFAAGILAQIYGMQHEVCWLASRRRRDAFSMGVACGGYILIAATAILTAGLLLLA